MSDSPFPIPAPVAGWACLKERLGLLRMSLFLCAFGLGPMLLAFFQDLWARPQYQFFPLALAAAALLAWQRINAQAVFPLPRRRFWAALWLGVSLASLALGVVFWLPVFGGPALLFCVMALAWLLGGRRLLAALAPSLLILLILTPPLGLESEVLRQLRRLAVRGSSTLLDYLRVLHSVEGNVIELPEKTLLVEEACSGINSLLLGMTFCVFYLFWHRRPALWLIVALPATFAFVILGNIVRITLGAALQFFANIDILSGHAHETAGLVLVATYILLICSLDQLLDFLTRKPGRAGASGAPAGQIRSPDESFVKPAWLPWCGFVYAAVGLVAVAQVVVHPDLLLSIGASQPKAVVGLKDNFVFPSSIGSWRRSESEEATNKLVEVSGVSSISSGYQLGKIKAVLALDYPLRGYHDAKLCYSSQGWVVQNEAIASAAVARTPPRFVEVNLRKNPLLFGFLCHGVINARGRWLEPPNASAAAALANRFNAMGRGFANVSSVRLQVLCVDSQALSQEDQAQVRQLFLSACQLLSQHLSAKE
jgi:exosortase